MIYRRGCHRKYLGRHLSRKSGFRERHPFSNVEKLASEKVSHHCAFSRTVTAAVHLRSTREDHFRFFHSYTPGISILEHNHVWFARKRKSINLYAPLVTAVVTRLRGSLAALHPTHGCKTRPSTRSPLQIVGTVAWAGQRCRTARTRRPPAMPTAPKPKHLWALVLRRWCCRWRPRRRQLSETGAVFVLAAASASSTARSSGCRRAGRRAVAVCCLVVVPPLLTFSAGCAAVVGCSAEPDCKTKSRTEKHRQKSMR